MKNLNLDYQNKYEVRNYINTVVLPSIQEDLVNGYGSKDFDMDYLNDNIWDIINGLGDVIYTYQAKKISEAFDFDVFSEDDLTGERFTSYNQIAFTIIYNEFLNLVY
jgi:hypothetical protein